MQSLLEKLSDAAELAESMKVELLIRFGSFNAPHIRVRGRRGAVVFEQIVLIEKIDQASINILVETIDFVAKTVSDAAPQFRGDPA